MNPSQLHPAARAYMEDLRNVSKALPRSQRTELQRDIESHLLDAIPADASEVDAMNVIERLGEPEEIVASIAPNLAAEFNLNNAYIAVILLSVGSALFSFFGWLAGLFMLWNSSAWNARDKWIGTFLLPGGWAALPVTFFGMGGLSGSLTTCISDGNGPEICTGGPSTLETAVQTGLTAVLILIPLCTTIYLLLRLRQANSRRNMSEQISAI